MANTWATFGTDLHLDLAGPRVRASLEHALRDAVETGRLVPGTRLPSSRTLAVDLGIARNTVATAYGQLVAEGWLTARSGSGTSVADRVRPGVTEVAMSGAGSSQPKHNLQPGTPDLSAFPRARWVAAARRALNTAPYEAFGYPDARGRLELRTALADYLARARGVRVTPDRLVIVSGLSQGFALLTGVLRARGARSMAMEGYGTRGQRELVARHGPPIVDLTVDQDGANVGDLGDADAVMLTPGHQFPLGVALSAPRRTLAVQWAHDTGGVIIEDDYDGEFRYDRKPLGAMQALAPEHVVYAGTASKTLAPGLRLGWLVLPAGLIDDFLAAKAQTDRQTPTLDQLTLAAFIAAGDYDRHLRRMRLTYRRRRDRLVAALQRHVPGVVITGIAAGLHALVELPPGQREDEIVTRAARLGLAVDGLGSYSAPSHHQREALVVGYGTPPEHGYTAAIARLCAALTER